MMQSNQLSLLLAIFGMFPQNFGKSAPVETLKNQIIEKPIITEKQFIITTSGGGYCRLR